MELRYGAADPIHEEFPSISPRPNTVGLLDTDDPGSPLSEGPEPEDDNNRNREEARAEFEELPEPVVKILMDRKESGYQRGKDNDGRKVGLTFDPGAYSGVVSLAMARKLEVAGLLEYVDAFYGLSAGGVNAAYAATGQIKEGMDTYVNLMPDNHLLTPIGIIPPKLPKMNLDVLRDAIYKQHPLKIDELINSKVPVVIGLTNVSNGYDQREMVRSNDADPDHPEKFMEKLIMGCNIPVLSGGLMTDKDNGDQYTDATLAWADSVELARADGCTHILSLANIPAPQPEKQKLKSKLMGYVAGKGGDWYVNSNSPIGGGSNGIGIEGIGHATAYLLDLIDPQGGSPFSAALKKKTAAENTYSEGLSIDNGVTVERIYPPPIAGLPELLTADKRRLRVGIRAGRLAIREALDQAVAPGQAKLAA